MDSCFERVTFRVQGTSKELSATALEIGKMLISLEIVRSNLGHKTISHSIRYIHGIDHSPSYIFVRDIILREYYKNKDNKGYV